MCCIIDLNEDHFYIFLDNLKVFKEDELLVLYLFHKVVELFNTYRIKLKGDKLVFDVDDNNYNKRCFGLDDINDYSCCKNRRLYVNKEYLVKTINDITLKTWSY